jgi:hypothetical protein
MTGIDKKDKQETSDCEKDRPITEADLEQFAKLIACAIAILAIDRSTAHLMILEKAAEAAHEIMKRNEQDSWAIELFKTLAERIRLELRNVEQRRVLDLGSPHVSPDQVDESESRPYPLRISQPPTTDDEINAVLRSLEPLLDKTEKGD